MKKIEEGVSIITIVLNGEKQIEETIQSVLSQKIVPFEYIIIDGGSADNTLLIINKYKTQISHLISGPDDGIYNAINKGISLAKYSLIGIIHCGDFYEPGIIATSYETFKKTNADVIYGNITHKEDVQDGYNIVQILKANHRNLKNKMSIFHPATFVKHSCYLEQGAYDVSYRCAADYDFFLSLYQKECFFYYVPKAFATFRYGGLSSTNLKILLKENFLIRKKRLGIRRATMYIILIGLSSYYYNARQFIIMFIVGKEKYNYLKRIKYQKQLNK